MTMPSSTLAPAGVQATHIASLFWTYFAIATVVFSLVSGAFALAIARRPSSIPEKTEPTTEENRPKRRVVAIAIALTCATLTVMLWLSVATSRALGSLSAKNAVPIEVVGHQWWWEFRYPASVAGTQFTTAYELHVPVGRPIEVKLSSPDVIHSFWVPSLHGKRDVIPGKDASLVLRADQPGRYQGQCAEFCGLQHANMRFVVVAESEEDFKAWLAHSLAPAPTPSDPVALEGQQVFMKSRCIMCHAIGGTEAFASVGPNLTHLASRREIAMGTLPNTPGHLAGWIVGPEEQKPGTAMPGTPLASADLTALLTYLGSLK
jgi:cytochrome c oxidase subunit II